MKKLLVTGGTVFVSKFTANYFSQKGFEVYVLNRNTKKQLDNVHLICADRNDLKDTLKAYEFDAVIDICAYTGQDIENLTAAINPVKDYIFISSSAVYPETNTQPFTEEQMIGPNSIWRKYGTDKIEAEQRLLEKYPNAYILRPPYLYGPMNDCYRESFVFDCALQKRKFYVPGDGTMKLQFFHVEDLCKMIEEILEKHPEEHIYNVGNDAVDINEFVEACYRVVGAELEKVFENSDVNPYKYFCFPGYQYVLDVKRQSQILGETKDFEVGLKESFEWYVEHQDEVERCGYIEFIDDVLASGMANGEV